MEKNVRSWYLNNDAVCEKIARLPAHAGDDYIMVDASIALVYKQIAGVLKNGGSPPRREL